MYHWAGLILLVLFGVLGFFFYKYRNIVRDLKLSLLKLSRSFHDLDQQAKLIVRTDLELNKAQEALDKRLNGLDALHKISRLISTTLDEQEIFNRINQPLLTELGFEKFLILLAEDNNPPGIAVDFGFPQEETQKVLAGLETDAAMLGAFKAGQMVSSLHAPADVKDPILALFAAKHFILTPVLAQERILGWIFAGNRSDAFTVTEGDEEIVSIFADQIGHAIENARLFEEVYRSRQALEIKVEQRTKELSSALEEVKKISRMKSEFISAVSHELRTPLTSIKGYAALLMTGKLGEIPPGVKERLEKINKHSDNLVQLINNLLDIARIESGRAEMHFLRHDLGPLVDNVADLLTPQLKDKGINFVKDLAPGVPAVVMDTGQIERVLINLVGNAIKFTPAQGTITVRVREEKGAVAVSVIDTGIGIKDEHLSKLFSEFYRIENAINQNIKGSGLGLALVKRIVQAHKGEVGVTSEPGHGTSFFFSLPVSQEQAGPAPPAG